MHCDHSNPAGYAFCAACGRSLPHRRCRCGFACEPGAAFCGRCGTELECAAEAKASPEGKYDLSLFLDIVAEQAPSKFDKRRVKMTQAEIRDLIKNKAKQT